MALGLSDVLVGVWTSPHALTGTTVVLPPEGTLGAMAVRGASPGTREAIALGPNGKLTTIHAAVLSGGSAFGLATADGVVSWLAARGIGYDIGVAKVPIVGAAIILDRGIAFADNRPDAAAGAAACDAATADDPPEGSVGAGTGATVAKTAGLEHCWRGGQGWAVHRSGEVVVGALVINNAVGEIVAEDGEVIAASRAPADVVRFPQALPFEAARDNGPAANTVIGAIVTNARLDKLGAFRVADLGHSGIVRSIRPAHTQYDGDALFCLATQRVETHVDLVAALAADAVAEAARRGPLAAHGDADIPGLADAR